MLSAFHILGRKASSAEISAWASNCSLSLNGYLYSTFELSKVSGVKAVLPSVCDGKSYSSLIQEYRFRPEASLLQSVLINVQNHTNYTQNRKTCGNNDIKVVCRNVWTVLGSSDLNARILEFE